MGLKLNVQDQNKLTEEAIRNCAFYWRKTGIPKALKEYAELNGVHWPKSIILKLEIDFPGMASLFGLLLNQDKKFLRFKLNTDKHHLIVESLEEWMDVTSKQNLNTSNRGIGSGYGALAVKVLQELNS
jgi:hypothetical protein